MASFSTKASAVSLSMEKVEVFFKDRVFLHSVEIEEFSVAYIIREIDSIDYRTD